MSWSISVIGKPENVVKALHEESAKQTGQCKIEFDDALPHLVGLVTQNFWPAEGEARVIELVANGSGYSKDGQQISRDCTASIKRFYTKLV